MNQQLEYRLQCWYVMYLRSKGILFNASSGGLHTTNIRAAVRNKKAGAQRGFPDVQIFKAVGRHHGMLVELKCGTYATADQSAWNERLSAEGYYAIIVPARYDYWQAQRYLETETERYLKGEIA